MKSRLKGLPILLLAWFTVLLTTNVVLAAPAQLSGKVTDSIGSPLADARVEVFTPGATTPLVGATTNTQGEYTLTLESGTYDLRVTPAAGSGFQVTTLEQQVIAGDTVVDFRLVLANPVTLRGRVLGGLGEGLADQPIQLNPAGFINPILATSDASGDYTFAVAPGNYGFVLNHGNQQLTKAPGYYYLRTTSPLALTTDSVVDLQLPVKQVIVHVQDAVGNPVAGVTLSTNDGNWNSNLTLGNLTAEGYSRYTYDQPVLPQTDANGNATLWLFPSAPEQGYSFTAAPPDGSIYATFNLHDVAISGDKTIVIALQFAHPAPVTTATVTPQPDAQGRYPDPATVTLAATAADGFRVAATYYQLDGGQPQLYSAPFAVAGAGAHELAYWSVDNSGVIESAKRLTFTIGAASGHLFYVSPSASGRIAGFKFKGEDILSYDPATQQWAIFFDGSDVGVGNSNLTAFHLQPDGTILMSFNHPLYLPGYGVVDDSDIVQFRPSKLGHETAGVFVFYFDGSDVGLTQRGEAIDAITQDAWGRLIISVDGSFMVDTLSGQDEDLFAFTATTLGANTAGRWALYFDGSDIGLTQGSEDVNSAFIDQRNGDIYLNTKGNFTVEGSNQSLTGTANDIFVCKPSSIGESTACAIAIFFRGGQMTYGKGIDEFAFGRRHNLAALSVTASVDDTTADLEGEQYATSVEEVDTMESDAEVDAYDNDAEGEQRQLLFLPLVKR